MNNDVLARRFRGNIDWFANQTDNTRKRNRNLHPIPAAELNVPARSYVERKDGLTGVTSKRHRAWLCHKCGTPRTVNRERDCKTVLQTLGHLGKRSSSAPRRRPASSAI